MGWPLLRKVGCAPTLISPIALIPVVEPRLKHPLAQAALFQKIFFQSAELLVNEVVGLVNQADGNVGDDFGRAGFHKLAVKFKGVRGFAA